MLFNVHFAKYIQSSCYIGKISEIFIKKGNSNLLFELKQEFFLIQVLLRKLMIFDKRQGIYKNIEVFKHHLK